MIGADGALPLPWIDAPLRRTLATQQAHALLLHGPDGVGQFEMALCLAQSWLCESPRERIACGACAGCRLVQAHTHPDLMVVLPEALREPLGWGAEDEDAAGRAPDDKAGKRKPSKEIRVDEVRRIIAFAQTTPARGHGKVVVLHPAERLNGVAANALLKTLEEPPGDLRLVLACAATDALLPTIRSRCQAVALPLPDTAVASRWLAERSVADPQVLLAAVGGQPQQALQWAADGVDAAQWTLLPRQLQQGFGGTLATWPLARTVEAMQKLCHDAMRLAVGAAPRYFPAASLPAAAGLPALAAWARELNRIARHAEHPWNAGLMVDSLVQHARHALAPQAAAGRPAGRASLHSPE